MNSMTTPSPRVLLVSSRNLWLHVARANALEFEHVIEGVDAVDIVSPTPVAEPPAVSWLNELAKRKVGLSYAPRKVRVEPKSVRSDYDLLFVNVPNLNFLPVLDGVAGFRERCQRTVCWIDELWAHEVDNPEMVARLQEFDDIVLATGGAVDALQPLVPGRVRASPMAVDTLRFCPLGQGKPRSIDLYWMGGRRSPTMHEALLRYSARSPFFYLYETTALGKPLVPLLEHRDALANTAQRTKAFITYRAKIDRPQQTRGQIEVGTRYFEAGAAGCVMMGEAPNTEDFADCFDWSRSGVTVPFGDAGVVDAMADLLRDPDRMAEAGAYSVRRCLERHDWLHRWQEAVLTPVGLPLHPRAEPRLEQLALYRARVARGDAALSLATRAS